MKSKKITMLVAALVVAIVALAGVGYAASTLKATTVNDGNNANSAYVTATQTGANAWTGAFGGKVDFYTYTDATHHADATNGVVYSIAGSTAKNNLYAKAIGSGVQINLTPATGVSATAYNVTASLTAEAALPTGWTYFVGYTGTGNEVFGNLGSATTVTPNEGVVTAQLYIAGPAFNDLDNTLPTVTGYTGLGSSMTYNGAANIYTSAKLMFVFDVTVA